jgi:hypothetical protein
MQVTGRRPIRQGVPPQKAITTVHACERRLATITVNTLRSRLRPGMVALLFTSEIMNNRMEFAVIVGPWLAFMAGLLIFTCWRDAQPLPVPSAQVTIR